MSGRSSYEDDRREEGHRVAKARRIADAEKAAKATRQRRLRVKKQTGRRRHW